MVLAHLQGTEHERRWSAPREVLRRGVHAHAETLPRAQAWRRCGTAREPAWHPWRAHLFLDLVLGVQRRALALVVLALCHSGRRRLSLRLLAPTRTLDFDALERAVDEEDAVVFAT